MSTSTTERVPARLRLVFRIYRDGTYKNAPFKVIHIGQSHRYAQRRAIARRKRGYLARVRYWHGYWLVAVRWPRRMPPKSRELSLY